MGFRFLLLLLFVSGCHLLFSQHDHAAERSRAKQLAGENRCEEAIAIFRGLLKKTDSVGEKDRYLSYWLEIASCELDLYHFDYAKSIYDRVLSRGETQAAPHDSIMAWAHGDLGYTFGKLSKFPEQLEQYQISLEYKLKVFGENHAEIGSAYNNLGTAYGRVRNFPKQLECYQKALKIRKEVLGPDHAKVGATLNNIGFCYGRMGDFERELEYYKQGLAIRLADLGEDHPRVGSSYSNIGFALTNMGRYEEAISHLQKALNIYKNHYGPEHPAVARIYQNLGPCHGNLSEFDQAITYSEKALAIQRQYYGEVSEQVTIAMNNLGAEYARIGKYEKALELHTQSLESRKKIWGAESPETAKALSNLAIVYSYQGDYEKAIGINRKVLAMRQKLLDEHDVVLIQSLGNLGAELLLADSLETAKKVLLEAVNRHQESQNPGRSFFHYYLHLSRAYALDSNLEASLKYMQLAMELEIPEMKGKGPLEPVPKNKLDQSAAVHNILEQKGQNLFMAGREKTDFIAANAAFAQAAESLDRLRMRFGKQSKITLGTEAASLFESWVANNYRLFELTGDNRYIEQAWQAASRSKAFLLREQLYKQRKSSYAGVPDSLVRKEQQLQARISLLLSKLQGHDDPGSEADSLRMQTWKTDLIELENQQARLIRLFRQKHPQYYREKFSLEAPDLERLQHKLGKEKIKMLQYFRAKNHLYIFFIDEKDILIRQQQLQADFDQKLKSYVSFFHQASWKEEEKELFIDLSQALFQILVAPFQEKFAQNDRVTIIPDQQLGYIPFETLLVSKDRRKGFAHLDYWLRHQAISYAYHSDFMLDIPKGDIAALVMAPAFGPGTDSLRAMMPRLRYGEEEQKAILKYFKGKKPEASESTFRQLAGNYALLHLTTHSLIDSVHPEASCLLFGVGDDSLNDGKLHNYELYNMRLSAQMAVLSACNTGIGKLQQGEGVMSLAHAFTYAGCPNVIMSLWQVNDHSTAELMQHFYQGLAEEKPKDVALREAKLAYLESADPLKASPYFWAGFVSIGEQAPLRRPSWAIAMWIALGLVVLGGGIVLYRKM